jgi:hypothetical protein
METRPLSSYKKIEVIRRRRAVSEAGDEVGGWIVRHIVPGLMTRDYVAAIADRNVAFEAVRAKLGGSRGKLTVLGPVRVAALIHAGTATGEIRPWG